MRVGAAGQALRGLRIIKAGDIAMVDDGADRWLCDSHALADAIEEMEGEKEYQGECAEMLAYTDLCRRVKGAVASLIGSPRGDWRYLVNQAWQRGLIENRSRYGY